MKILNFLWHFSTGGVGKCFLTYDKLGEVTNELQVKSVCVINKSIPCDCEPLIKQRIEIIYIKDRKDFSWMKRLVDVVNVEKPDMFFCHGYNGPIMLYLFRLRYNLKIPFICSCHGTNVDKSKKGYSFLSYIWMFIYRKSFVRKIICVEKFTPPQLVGYGVNTNKIVTVYNGVEPFVESKRLDLSAYPINSPIIITASRLTRIKGVNYLIDALATLKVRNVKFHYFCIGNGEEEENLKAQAQERGLSNEDITFMGYQNNIPDWLATCDIFALPSLEEFHSIAILEAMRAKKAIVATNIGGNPESLRDGIDALMVPDQDVQALAVALEKLLTSSELRYKLSENAHDRFKEMFTVDVMMKNLAHEILSTK